MHYTDTDSNIDRKLCKNKKEIVILPHYSYPATSTWLHYLTYIVTLSPPHSHTTLLEWSHYLNHVVALPHCIVTSSILLLSKSEKQQAT